MEERIRKAGTVLVDFANKKVCLIHRIVKDDVGFPKGHVEDKESIPACAIRETREEALRIPFLLAQFKPAVIEYKDYEGKDTVAYYFLAKDMGEVKDGVKEETHDVVWTDFDKVEEALSYDELRDVWNRFKPIIEKIVK